MKGEVKVDKELKRLKQMANNLINKVDEKGIKFIDFEVGAVSQIGKANAMKEINWFALEVFERTCEKYKVG
ncbi:hypothetical protein [Bacillus sp. NPDC094106]|uniref:hypothetical protein n=1 Tax=Bacillus sp. NPDC094106 TaxID=3363949 RepID=UPI00382880E1